MPCRAPRHVSAVLRMLGRAAVPCLRSVAGLPPSCCDNCCLVGGGVGGGAEKPERRRAVFCCGVGVSTPGRAQRACKKVGVTSRLLARCSCLAVPGTLAPGSARREGVGGGRGGWSQDEAQSVGATVSGGVVASPVPAGVTDGVGGGAGAGGPEQNLSRRTASLELLDVGDSFLPLRDRSSRAGGKILSSSGGRTLIARSGGT